VIDLPESSHAGDFSGSSTGPGEACDEETHHHGTGDQGGEAPGLASLEMSCEHVSTTLDAITPDDAANIAR
jgi:hypothetical protein